MKNIKINETSYSGIYKIINISNSKIYIGSSVNIYYRIKMHLSHLRRNIHGNIYLQRSFNKYGENNFKVEIIEKCNKDILRIREEYYITTLKPDYNMKTSTYISEISNELKERISKTLKRKYKSGEIKKIWNKDAEIPVKVYNYKGEFITNVNSISKCARDFNLNLNNLRTKLKFGYYWYNEYMIIKKEDNLENIINSYFKNKKLGDKLTNLPILFVTKDNTVIFYKSPFHRAKQKILGSKNLLYITNKKCKLIPNAPKGIFTFIGLYARIKSDKLLETPEEDNQQPI